MEQIRKYFSTFSQFNNCISNHDISDHSKWPHIGNYLLEDMPQAVCNKLNI